MRYEPAVARQAATHQAVLSGHAGPTLLLVEHEPVVTVSRRRDAAGHLRADDLRLASLGIELARTDRGGDVTYHGPGQLVAYPILRLTDFGLNVGRYMRLLEQAVIEALAGFDLPAEVDPPNTGVWVVGDRSAAALTHASDESGSPGRTRGGACDSLAKICAMGIRVRRNVTMHGLALNVTTDLSHFETIVPCGLPDRAVTSLSRELGDACPPMAEVKAALAKALDEQLAAAKENGSRARARGVEQNGARSS